MEFRPVQNFIDLNAKPQPEPAPIPEPQETDEEKMDQVLQAVKDLSSKVKQKDQTAALTKAILGLSTLFKKQVDDNDEIKNLLGQLLDKFSIDIPAPVVNVPAPIVNLPPQDAPIVNLPAPIVNVSPAPVTLDNSALPEILKLLKSLKKSAPEAADSPGPVAGKRKMPKLIPETPTGTINGVNTVFYLSRQPKWGTQAFLFYNGQYQTPGTDFSFSDNQITYTQAPTAGGHYVLFFQ